MKLVVVAPKEPLSIGGVERVVREFSIRLRKKLDVEIVCSGHASNYYEIQGVPVHVVKGYTGFYSYAPGAREVIEALKPDLLYVHAYSSYMPYLVSRIKKREERIKFVLHPHFHPRGSTISFRFMRDFYDPLIGSSVFHSADAVIANSKSELHAIRNAFQVPKPAFVVYNGINLELIARSAKRELPSETVLLFVGRLEPYKNPLLAVDLMKLLPSRFCLFIIGTGPLYNKVAKHISALGLQDRVHLLGFVSDQELYEWYKTADSLLQLSESESFGMTCIEALAAGTPSLANDDKFGLRETIELFPKSIIRCDVKSDRLRKIADLTVATCSLKPVDEDLSGFSWDSLSHQLSQILIDVSQQ